jgi:short subunit dehydrogenase-like uncharacterized protein
MADRPYDVVLFGATGFAGGLTAEYLARNAPDGCRWALAGRNRTKLETVRGKLAAIDPALSSLDLLLADSSDAAALTEIARSTRVVATTVGPYVLYGEPLVAACAAAGTDYVDLTGEPEFVDTMYARYHAQAVRTGARLVHACGFDSVPHDLGAYYTVQHLPEGVPLTIRGYVQASAMFSGGTFASALTGFSRARQNVAAARERKRTEDRGPRSVDAAPGRPHRAREAGGWALPFPSLDPQVIARSARAVERYGPDFHYSHFIAVPHLWTAGGVVGGVAGLFVAAQIPPARTALLKRLPAGEGPSPAKRARSWFRVTFVGAGGGQRVVTQVSGGDPGYDETAKMLAESALALAFDDLPHTAGQVTTVTAMGDALLLRLQKAGLGFQVLQAAQ